MISWPAATVDHRSASLVQVATELRVAGVPLRRCGGAAVHLDVVHAPLGEGVGVGLEMAETSRVAHAGLGTWATP